MNSSGAPTQPRDPQEFGWLVNNFVASTPGVAQALIVSSDGLPLIASNGMSADVADPLSAMTSGMISLGHSIAGMVGEDGCDQIMLKFRHGHFLFMAIGSLAGLAVLVKDGANLGVVAHRMAQLVDSVGHVLTPRMRDDLRRLSAGQSAS
jgi:predicted regulator of Ras-like GTPase activity (Roadblock/LC7/MglB family)